MKRNPLKASALFYLMWIDSHIVNLRINKPKLARQVLKA